MPVTSPVYITSTRLSFHLSVEKMNQKTIGDSKNVDEIIISVFFLYAFSKNSSVFEFFYCQNKYISSALLTLKKSLLSLFLNFLFPFLNFIFPVYYDPKSDKVIAYQIFPAKFGDELQNYIHTLFINKMKSFYNKLTPVDCISSFQ